MMAYYLRKNGFLIDVPLSFYDVDKYGYEWRTFKEFYQKLKNAKKNGLFDNTKVELARVIQFCFDNPEEVYDMEKRSYDIVCNEFSANVRNKRILEIYKSAINDHKR